MKTSRFIIVLMLLSSILFFTAGCGPVWTVSATKYAKSRELYDSNSSHMVEIAADNNTFLIVGVHIEYKGSLPGQIEDELVFKLEDTCVPFSYPNYYEVSSTYDVYDDIKRVYSGGQSDDGSIFFQVPYDTNIIYCTFKAMKADYTILFSQKLNSMTFISDYPASW